jgi:endonuclease/exonuclease/phosphatase family metal-dependent hydrolase
MNIVKIVTYNVRRCLGMDGHVSPARIAEVIRNCKADIVALQELDVGRKRTDSVDQARAIADTLAMQFHFHPALNVFEELYGDAILTARPSRLVKAASLPGIAGAEPRGALWVSLQVEGRRLDILNTHFGLSRAERRLQSEALLGPGWIGHPARRPGLILAGDFNAVPHSRTWRRLTRALCDARRLAPRPVGATFPSALPLLRLDHLLVGPAIDVIDVRAVGTPLARLASDHLPLAMTFRLKTAADRAKAQAA